MMHFKFQIVFENEAPINIDINTETFDEARNRIDSIVHSYTNSKRPCKWILTNHNIINGTVCLGTSSSLWGIFGRGGCIEKLWQTSNGQYQIYESEKEAQSVLDKIRKEEFDGLEVGCVGEICMSAVDKIHYSKR